MLATLAKPQAVVVVRLCTHARRKLHIIRQPAADVKLDFLTAIGIGGIIKMMVPSFYPVTPFPPVRSMAVLNYGISSCVELEFAEGVLLGEVGIPRGEPLADLDAATTAALANPIDYPSLARSTTPADHVVLALDRGVPQVAQVTASIVDALIDSGIDPDGITVLRNQADLDAGADNPCRLVPAPLRKRITLLDPRSGRSPAVGLSRGQPLGRSDPHQPSTPRRRRGLARRMPASGRNGRLLRHPRGRVSGVFRRENHPTVSEPRVAERTGEPQTRTLCRGGQRGLAAGHQLHRPTHSGRRRPGAARRGGPEQLGAAAGTGIVSRGVELARLARAPAWSWPRSKAMRPNKPGKTWAERCKRPASSSKRMAPSPSVAIWPLAPGRRCSAWRTRRREDSAQRPDGPQRPADALPAAQLAHALQQHKVYLLSRLDPSVVEDLDVFPLAGPDELARLVRRHRSCILLSNAQYVTTTMNR